MDRDIQYDISHRAMQLLELEYEAKTMPSVLFRPKIFIDGDQWCVLYGKDLQDGVAGFGETPHAAMSDFDRNWHNFKARKELDKERE